MATPRLGLVVEDNLLNFHVRKYKLDFQFRTDRDGPERLPHLLWSYQECFDGWFVCLCAGNLQSCVAVVILYVGQFFVCA